MRKVIAAGAMNPGAARAQVFNQPVLLGEYATNYTWDSDPSWRVNLAVASTEINNTILAPGEMFSFNEAVAPLAFQPAKVIIGSKVDYAEGGGLCQVSSTLYMAANYAGLKILERSPTLRSCRTSGPASTRPSGRGSWT